MRPDAVPDGTNDPVYEAGEIVRLVAAPGNRPPLGSNMVGREGRVEHHSPVDWDGCYLRFEDGSYVYAFYDEIERVPA